MNRFLIDFKKFISMYLALFAKTVRISWLYALLKPLENLHDEFISYGNEVRADVKYNGQTIALENLLIQRFGAGIYIQNFIQTANPFFLYPATNSANPFVYPASNTSNPLIYPPNSYDPEGVGFKVFVPASLVFNEDQMKAIINRRVAYSVTYSIETY